MEYTFIRVGEIVEGKEGGSVMVANATDDLPVEQVVRDDIIRLSAESFMMQNATNKVRYRRPWTGARRGCIKACTKLSVDRLRQSTLQGLNTVTKILKI